MSGNNIIFHWKGALLRTMISDDRLKQHTEIINIKYEYNNFAMNPMEQISNIFEISRKN